MANRRSEEYEAARNALRFLLICYKPELSINGIRKLFGEGEARTILDGMDDIGENKGMICLTPEKIERLERACNPPQKTQKKVHDGRLICRPNTRLN